MISLQYLSQVVGSRPAPSIYWWLDGQPLAQAATQVFVRADLVSFHQHHLHHHCHDHHHSVNHYRSHHHFHDNPPDLPLWKSDCEHS